MRLIDHYLPEFQFSERHTLVTDIAPARLMDAVQQPGTTEDPWARRFIWLREAPDRLLGALGAGSGLQHRPAFGIEDFMPLGRDGDREVAFGLIGRFWQRDYGLVQLAQPQAQFRAHAQPHQAKLVLHFSATPRPDGRTELVTETRVHCLDADALRRFTPYWWLIRPVSGLIRRRLLARICRVAKTLPRG